MPSLTYNPRESRFELALDFNDTASRNEAKAARFRWAPIVKRWWTADPEAARLFAEFGDDEARARLQADVNRANAAVAASKAVDADVDIPAPEGLTYLPYQRAGIAYALQRPGVLIGDEMGLGKTIQAIGIINADPSIESVLIICPASLRLNWARELEKWLTRSYRIEVCNGKQQTLHAQATGAGDTVYVTLINYDVLRNFPELRESRWDTLIVDEAHYLKNGKAQRTAHVLGRWHRDPAKRVEPIKAGRRVFLTGTPLLNRPAELYTIARSLDHARFGNWHQFHTRYCDAHRTRFGWDVSGASNLDELQRKLRQSIMVRRLKSEVLKELPSKVRQIVVLPENGLSSLVKAERKAVEAIDARLAALRARVELAKAAELDDEYVKAVEALRDEGSAAFQEIARLRHDLAVAKLPKVSEFVAEAAVEHPVVVMAHHHDVVDGLKAALEEAELRVVTLTGRDSMEHRQAAVDAFQAGDADVFIGNIKAAGVGITLTRASHVVFAELDWTPANLSQAEDRCHRIGQTDSVLVHHLVVDGSLDARMANVVVEKQRVLDAALDTPTADESLPAAVELPSTGGATEGTPRSKVREAGEKLTTEQRAIVHQALRVLAGVCDGAQNLDGMGFNALDTRIGKELALASSLTVGQAGLGWLIVRKYRRQLEGAVDYRALYTQ